MVTVCCLLLAFVEVDIDKAERETNGCCDDGQRLLSIVLAPRCIVRLGTLKASTKIPVDTIICGDITTLRIEDAVVAKK